MSTGWPTYPLESLCAVFADGDWVESKDQSTKGIRLVQTGNVGEGVFKNRDQKARYISESTFSQLRCTDIFSGDCLISRLPDPVGRSCILPETGERMITAVDCTIVRFKPDRMTPMFFNYYSQSSDYLRAVDAQTSGTTRKRISRSKLGEIRVPVPPLPEQERIVGILDEAFAAIAKAKANAEKNLRNAREVFESALTEIFCGPGAGWIESAIGDHIRFIDYRGKTPVKTAQGLRLITAKNVKMGHLQTEPMEFVAPESYDSWMTRGIPRRGDVLFTTEAPLANVAQLDTNDRVVFAQRIIIMQPDAAHLDDTFLKYLLLSPPIQSRVRAQGTGATVQGIKASLLRAIRISFPAKTTEQRRIAARLDAIAEQVGRISTICERKGVLLDALKQSLLHHAFTGQLTAKSAEALLA